MTAQLPALQVVVPLVAAPLCLLLRNARAAHALAVAVAWVSFAIAAALLQATLDGDVVSYALGGWEPPWGIEYRVDVVSAFVLAIVAGVAAVVLLIGPGPGGLAAPERRVHLFYAAYLLCLAGLLGVTITGDAFNVFVFLEIASLASYTLVSLGRDRRALRAAFSYLILGTIGGTFILIGVGLLYQMTGTLNMADLAARLPRSGVLAWTDAPPLATRTVRAAFAFLLVGVSLKLALFPLHQWLPNAYTYAPAPVSAFLAGTATKVAYYLLARLAFTVFGAAFVFETLRLHLVLLPLSLAAVFVGAAAAIYQSDLRRLLAYSSVSQIGYMTLGLSFGTATGLAGGLVHLANHALIKGGLFLVVASVAARVGSLALGDLRGLGRRMPLTAAAFVAGGLGLIGVPGTAGFITKWYLVLAALETGDYMVALLVVASSLLAAVYVWRVVEVAYFQEPPEGAPRGEAPLGLLAPTWILIGASVAFGLYTRWTAGVAEVAAAQLLGGA